MSWWEEKDTLHYKESVEENGSKILKKANLYLQYDWEDTKETNWGSKDYIKKPPVKCLGITSGECFIFIGEIWWTWSERRGYKKNFGH